MNPRLRKTEKNSSNPDSDFENPFEHENPSNVTKIDKSDPAMVMDILKKAGEKELSPYISKFHPLKMGLKQV